MTLEIYKRGSLSAVTVVVILLFYDQAYVCQQYSSHTFDRLIEQSRNDQSQFDHKTYGTRTVCHKEKSLGTRKNYLARA